MGTSEGSCAADTVRSPEATAALVAAELPVSPRVSQSTFPPARNAVKDGRE